FTTQFFLDDLLQQPDVVFFQPFIEELRWHLDGQDVVLQLQGADRLEPRLETLLAHVVPDHLEAPFPDLLMVFLHGSVQWCWVVVDVSLRAVIGRPYPIPCQGAQIWTEESEKKKSRELDGIENSLCGVRWADRRR